MTESAQVLLKQLWAIATCRATDLLAVKQGQLEVRDTDRLTESQQLAIAAIEKGPGGVKVKFYDKLKALELLGKHMGLFEQGAAVDPQQSNLLEQLLAATDREVSLCDLPEVQQTAVDRHDMVESAEYAAL